MKLHQNFLHHIGVKIACSCGNTNSMPIYIVRAKLHVICFFYTTWVWNCLLLRGHQLIAKSHYICVDKKCRNWINKNVGMNTKIITNKYIVEDKEGRDKIKGWDSGSCMYYCTIWYMTFTTNSNNNIQVGIFALWKITHLL